MMAVDKLQGLCQEGATDAALSGDCRDEFRLEAFLARSRDRSEGLGTREGQARFLRDGEKLLVELARHPRAGDVVQALFWAGCANTFDVPGGSAQVIRRLQKVAAKLANPALLRGHIRAFAGLRDEWIKKVKELLRKFKSEGNNNYLAAELGDAQAAIDLFSQDAYRAHPRYREWLRAARRKRREEGKGAPQA
jgi:hypothetical protein